MEITVNESEPEDSIDRYVMDTISTGEEALEIPPHWHMVSQCSDVTRAAGMLNRHEYS
jgi:hypothetical protein